MHNISSHSSVRPPNRQSPMSYAHPPFERRTLLRHPAIHAMSEHEPQSSAGAEVPGPTGKLSRRIFLSQLGTSGLAAGAMSLTTSVSKGDDPKTDETAVPKGFVQVNLTVNGAKHTVRI